MERRREEEGGGGARKRGGGRKKEEERRKMGEGGRGIVSTTVHTSCKKKDKEISFNTVYNHIAVSP